MTPKARSITLLLSGIALIFVILGLQLITAPPAMIDETLGEAPTAHVSFSADRKLLIAPGSCVTVRWTVTQIKAVYINDAPTVGSSAQVVCVDPAAPPTLRVRLLDGSQAEFHLALDFLINLPSTWLLVVALLVLLLAVAVVVVSRPAVPVAAPASPDQRVPRMVNLFAGIGLVCVTILLLALLLELGLRFYFANFGTTNEKIAYLYTRDQINALNQGTVPLPEVDYGLSPSNPEHDALGYRGGAVQIPKPAGTFRIVALGGSTTYGTSVTAAESYPAQLQQVLRDDYGYANVEVVNAGVAGYTTFQTFVNLAYRVTELQPDLVIIYHAGNDVLPREVDPDCYAGQNPLRGVDPRGRISVSNLNIPLSSSALYRFVALNLGWMTNPATLAGLFVESPIDCGGSQNGADVAHNVEINRPIYFERNERNMIAVTREYGFKIMFASWAYHTGDSSALPFWQTAVVEHNAITARVAQAEDALYFDYAAVAPTTDASSWADYVHMSASGNLSRAQAFAQFIDAQGIIPKS